MSRGKTLVILSLITAAVVAGAYLTRQGSDAIPMSGKPLLPGLLNQLDEVHTIGVTGRGKSFSIQSKEGLWVVPDRSDYIASARLVHQLLVGMSEVVRIEAKTSKPHLYAKVGLGDPASAGEDSGMVRYVLTDDDDKRLATLVIGQTQDARGGVNLSEYYILKDDDPQVWLVQGKLPTDNQLEDWIDAEIMGIEPERVAKVTVQHPDGETVMVTRVAPQATDFTLVDQPEGSELVEKWQIDDIGRGLARLQFADVTKGALDDVPGGGVPGITVTMLTHDGMRVVMNTVSRPRDKAADGNSTGDAPLVFATLEASFDESLVNQALQAQKTAGAEVDPASLEREERLKHEAIAKIEEPAAVKEEVEAVNRKWAGWVYELEDYKARHLLRKMADLIKPMEASAPEPAPVQGPPLAPQGQSVSPASGGETSASDSESSVPAN